MNQPVPAMNVTSRINIHLLVFVSGLAALSWEVLWHIKSTLALGVSAWGAAITLAVTMGGMSAGALVMGYVLRRRENISPLRLYGALECVIGAAGLLLNPSFRLVEQIDSWAYIASPDSALFVHLLGISILIAVPTFCMGATLPVLGLAARQFKTPLALLYGLNTLGAAAGALLAGFALIPLLGVSGTIMAAASLNIAVGITAFILGREGRTIAKPKFSAPPAPPQFNLPVAIALVMVTGFATFLLEVAWFRSLTAAFRSTTDAFAIMLSCVLIALGVGARLVPALRANKASLGALLVWSGIFILLATPLIERFDYIMVSRFKFPVLLIAERFLATLFAIGIPVTLLGVALPWMLDEQTTARRWGLLYGLNALAAIIGALSAGWIFLPLIGFAKTAWLAGALVAVAGLMILPVAKRKIVGALAIAALVFAVVLESGVGRTRAQGWNFTTKFKAVRVLESYEGPDATVSAVEYDGGQRAIIIDGFTATFQVKPGEEMKGEHYMVWMGHLPMLLHPDPRDALVICFGTGQTANAVRRENPESLDIVDINPHIFDLADNFALNEDVLSDPRVKSIVMDGRAYIRRTSKTYDVITLEPMPPSFAGVNALYSKEFYQQAREKLNEEGIIVQWLPFHLVAPPYSNAIARTFQSVFPNSILWSDPVSKTGILIGSKNENADLGAHWPGFKRVRAGRSLSEREIKESLLMDRNEVAAYAGSGKIISDDNQYLAYGGAVLSWHGSSDRNAANYEIIDEVLKMAPRDGIEPPTK